MNMSFGEFIKIMFGVVLPCTLLVLAYALLISLISNTIVGGFVFIVTIVPQMFMTLKIMNKLSDKFI